MRNRMTACLLTVLCWTGVGVAPDDPKPGFNLFSVEQDIEIGRQSAAEAEKQLPILRDQALERYLNAVVRELAEVAPSATASSRSSTPTTGGPTRPRAATAS